MEYETARNLTLLFFLERLMERGEPRTLHDLSCQFGSKGFTKEMRQIAGGSQSGMHLIFLYLLLITIIHFILFRLTILFLKVIVVVFAHSIT